MAQWLEQQFRRLYRSRVQFPSDPKKGVGPSEPVYKIAAHPLSVYSAVCVTHKVILPVASSAAL